ncbi:FAD-binding oxidoreductase [Arcobacteraceae bacterium]|nr:FAD-binding oxidoreductase [Arcobacteraceae bacterium]
MLNYDYIIIGAGISGCSVAFELSKYNDNILLLDKLPNTASGASGAAGAFLSPLLGKQNDFKDLVTKSLKYSTNFYKQNFAKFIDNCGTTRIPQNEEDAKKFKSYIDYIDFEYEKENDGYFFKIGSVVNSYAVCKAMIELCKNKVTTKFNYKVKTLSYDNDIWNIDNEIEAKSIILTTGSDVALIDQFYLNIRAVWGSRIDISTTTEFSHNYHKACSISKSYRIQSNKNIVSIGATHHRNKDQINDISSNTQELLKKANDIKTLENVEVLHHYVGARACSIDYFPILGEVIDGKKTIAKFPYLINGTNVDNKRFTRFKNLYVLTGVGGRGFVLAPYLAKQLVEHIVNGKELDKNIQLDRLFKREVKRYTNPL